MNIGKFKFDNAASLTQIAIPTIKVNSNTAGNQGNLEIDFKLPDREIYYTEHFSIDLAAFVAANTIPSLISCILKQGVLPSFLFKTVDMTSLNAIKFVPKADINTQNIQFTLKCSNLFNPSTTTGPAIQIQKSSAMIFNSQAVSYTTFTTPLSETVTNIVVNRHYK